MTLRPTLFWTCAWCRQPEPPPDAPDAPDAHITHGMCENCERAWDVAETATETTVPAPDKSAPDKSEETGGAVS